MSDDQDKNNQDELHEEFEEEFEIEEDVLTPEDEIEQELEAAAQQAPQAQRRSLLLPILIGVGILGFIGWKVYGIFQSSLPEDVAPVATEEGLPRIDQEITQETETTAEDQVTPKAPEEPQVAEEPQVTEKPTEAKTLSTPPISQQPVEETKDVDETVQAPSAQPQVIPALPSQMKTQAAPTEEKPAVAAPIPAADIQKQDKAITDLQSQLKSQEETFNAQLKVLEQNIQTAIDNAAVANKGIGALQQDISGLSTTLQTLSKDMAAVRQEQQKQQVQVEKEKARLIEKPMPRTAPRSETKPAPQSVPTTNLSVHAIIPGRAWLRSPDGKTLSISEGDAVSGLGKVLKIDAYNGIVVMSSGVVIR